MGHTRTKRKDSMGELINNPENQNPAPTSCFKSAGPAGFVETVWFSLQKSNKAMVNQME
jgi:hypothetical protein